jgi:hypothetical protein
VLQERCPRSTALWECCGTGSSQRRPGDRCALGIEYRGTFLRVGDDTDSPIRGRVFRTDRIKLDIDFDLVFGSDSDDIAARTGMPDLDLLLELGPELELQFVDRGPLAADGDGYGNICDADINNSGTVTTADFGLLRSVLGQPASFSPTAAAADMNGSGTVTTADFGLLRARLGTAPGPSFLHP